MCVAAGVGGVGGFSVPALLTRPCGVCVALSGRGTGEGRLGAACAFGSLRSNGLESVPGHPETCDVRLFPWAPVVDQANPFKSPQIPSAGYTCFPENMKAAINRQTSCGSCSFFGGVPQRLYTSGGRRVLCHASPGMKKTLGVPWCPHDQVRPLLVWASPFVAFGKQTQREGVLAPNCLFTPSPAAAHGDPGSLSLWPLVLFFLVHGMHGGQEKGLFVPLESLQPGIDLMSGRPLPPPPPGPPKPRSSGQEPDSQVPPCQVQPRPQQLPDLTWALSTLGK